MQGRNRTIGFDNCERYFAKGTRGIHGILKIPELAPGQPNDFLTKLFDLYNNQAKAEAEGLQVEKQKYDAAMAKGYEIIDSVKDVASANGKMADFKAIDHALTSNKELGVAWNKKIEELGLFWDKVLGKYTAAPKEKEAE